MKAATVLIKTDRLHAVIFGMNMLKEKKKGTIITVFAAIVLGCMYANHKCIACRPGTTTYVVCIVSMHCVLATYALHNMYGY